MIRWQAIFLSLLVPLFSVDLFSQPFGGNPSSIKWRQVNTNAAKVIYPKGMDSVANRVATITELLNEKYTGTIGNEHRKISVILQANNTVSNSYVGLAPYRSEFYLTTPQDPFELGSLRWADNLSIHEFRHVEQYSNFNHGLSKAFSILLGEQGQAFANSVSVPDWFFEGDAVWNETAFSRLGRGRLPESFNGYKSLYYADKQYRFMKLRNGSLRNYVPNYYDLGYLLVAYGREQYGDSIWQKISADAVRFKGLFYPLQKAVKRHTGIPYTTFTKNAFDYYQTQWNNEKSGSNQSVAAWITNPEKHNVVDYKYPYPANENDIIVLKRSYRKIPTFIKLTTDGKEEKIAVKDIANDDYFSYKNGRIIYTTTKPDIRWGNRDYGIIRVLDIGTKKTTTLTSKSKYFSPDISSDGKQVITVEANSASTCMLHLLSSNGDVLKRWTADPGLFYSQPKFLNDDRHVVVAARRQDGNMGWLEWNTITDDFKWLLEPAPQIIGFPVVKGDTLFYSGTAGKSDGLFAINLKEQTPPVLLANYNTGIYQGFEVNGKIIAAAFTAEGYRLGYFQRPGNKETSRELAPLYVSKTFNNKPDLTAVQTKMYPSERYRKTYKLFNFHSWQPEISEKEYTVSLLGENVLSTLLSQVYYTYNLNENSHEAGVLERYGGWYVQPFINGSQTWNREVELNTDTTLTYNETNATAGLYLPLNLSFGKAYRYLTLSSSFSIDNAKWSGYAKDRYQNQDVNYITARAVYSVQIQKAVQQIYPRYAESFIAQYQSAVNTKAWQWLLNGSLYLPGLSVNHNLVLTAAYQIRDTFQNYVFTNSFPFSRGYQDINFPKMLKLGANYHLPLVYPDWGFGNILYFQRVRLNAFYDYTRGESIRTGIAYPFSTVGGEMYFDTKWWNQLPVTFGVRYSRLLDSEFRGTTNPNQWEFILPINLLPR
jgi:hypothetical protein